MLHCTIISVVVSVYLPVSACLSFCLCVWLLAPVSVLNQHQRTRRPTSDPFLLANLFHILTYLYLNFLLRELKFHTFSCHWMHLVAVLSVPFAYMPKLSADEDVIYYISTCFCAILKAINTNSLV